MVKHWPILGAEDMNFEIIMWFCLVQTQYLASSTNRRVHSFVLNNVGAIQYEIEIFLLKTYTSYNVIASV